MIKQVVDDALWHETRATKRTASLARQLSEVQGIGSGCPWKQVNQTHGMKYEMLRTFPLIIMEGAATKRLT